MTVVLRCSPTAVYAVVQELPITQGVRLTGMGATIPSTSGTIPTLHQVAGVPLVFIYNGVDAIGDTDPHIRYVGMLDFNLQPKLV
jgi:hypothetical protein